MSEPIDFELSDDAAELAQFDGWSEEVYRDLMAVRDNRMTVDEFGAKYIRQVAILVLDLTGFTVTARNKGAVPSFLRILDAHRLCLPVLKDNDASFVRFFADDVVALFDTADQALDAALEIDRRTSSAPWLKDEAVPHAHCCIGLGFGPVYAIGPNRAMGDEMNRTSKLGEDIAAGGEILLTKGAFQALRDRADVDLEEQIVDDPLFTFYRVQDRS